MEAASPNDLLLWVAHGNETGDLLGFELDLDSGELDKRHVAHTGASASFLAFDPSRRVLYVTHNRTDRLSAWAAGDPPSRLGEVAVAPSEGEEKAGPAYVSLEEQHRFVLVANYRGHNAVVFALDEAGRPGEAVANVSCGRNAHSVVVSPDGRFVLVPCLGSDRIAQLVLDRQTGALLANQPEAALTNEGAGPRHLAFHPTGKLAFVVGELDAHVYSFRYDAAQGVLARTGRIDSLPAGYAGRRWAADLHVSPNGRFLYVSNRAHDSLAAFAIDPEDGTLSLLGHESSGGVSPRNFCVHPSGRFAVVANQDSHNLVTFVLDPTSGRMERVAETASAEAPYFAGFFPWPDTP